MMRAKTTPFNFQAFQGKANQIKLTEHVIKLDVLAPKFQQHHKASFRCILEEVDISQMLEVEISKMDLEIFSSNCKRHALKTRLNRQIREIQVLMMKAQEIENVQRLNVRKLRQISMINQQMTDSELI